MDVSAVAAAFDRQRAQRHHIVFREVVRCLPLEFCWRSGRYVRGPSRWGSIADDPAVCERQNTSGDLVDERVIR
jgi:hypothetical protein